MKDIRFFAKPHYANSYALVIGIDQYASASPLSYAVSDARSVRDILVSDFEFPAENVTVLEDGTATRDAIRKAFFRFTRSDIGLDDRIFIFFAGHGHTVTGARGEIGYLVPHDADMDDYSTFIRWDDLTSNSEQIRSKHVLFVMDACYGGLALTRNTQPGSTRFLKDMMLRYSRQVLTAGKADEVVADSGGPLPDHSVFTGHFLEALQGKAVADGGVITAASVMAYVYNKVAHDRNSNQTPHYGHFDGDGDFIFKAPGIEELEESEQTDSDRLISIPYPTALATQENSKSKIARVKLLLSQASHTIELHDFLTAEVRAFQGAAADDSFGLSEGFSAEAFVTRLNRYEEVVATLSDLGACTAYWGAPEQLGILQKCFARVCDQLDQRGGLDIWLQMRWYPVLVAFYASCVAAVDAKRFDTLCAIFDTPVPVSWRNGHKQTLVEALADAIADLSQTGVLKLIPGHERNYTPLSEYLFKFLQPKLDDLLFMGKGYEQAFDSFEVYFALAVADKKIQSGQNAWGPVGRFGWKARGPNDGPLARIVTEGNSMGKSWAPLQAGMFGGDADRFQVVGKEYGPMITRLHWH
ncbi:caspase family protein [Burkholderia sp. PR2]|uniref:caspase family protein n=1 Tax=Burkholderia sp. PR2 TaxID=3448078 RepID=UPI00402AE81A